MLVCRATWESFICLFLLLIFVYILLGSICNGGAEGFLLGIGYMRAHTHTCVVLCRCGIPSLFVFDPITFWYGPFSFSTIYLTFFFFFFRFHLSQLLSLAVCTFVEVPELVDSPRSTVAALPSETRSLTTRRLPVVSSVTFSSSSPLLISSLSMTTESKCPLIPDVQQFLLILFCPCLS